MTTRLGYRTLRHGFVYGSKNGYLLMSLIADTHLGDEAPRASGTNCRSHLTAIEQVTIVIFPTPMATSDKYRDRENARKDRDSTTPIWDSEHPSLTLPLLYNLPKACQISPSTCNALSVMVINPSHSLHHCIKHSKICPYSTPVFLCSSQVS